MDPSPYDPNQQGSSPTPYDPNKAPQYGNPTPEPQWQSPSAQGYTAPGTFDPQSGAYAPQAGGFNTQTGGYGTQPPKKSRTGLIVGVIVLVLVLLCLVCGGAGWLLYTNSDGTGPSLGSSGSHTVVYEVEGSGQATVMWSVADGGTEQAQVTLPWSEEIRTTEDSISLLVVAYATEVDAKIDSCGVTVDDKLLDESGASGTRRTVTCSTYFVD